MDWHAYITETPYLAFKRSDEYQRCLRLSDALQRVCELYHGDLRYKNVQKRIIQEPTQPVAIAKGHPPFCFRFQCLTTGRKSKFIKESDYAAFGITKQEAQDGTGYPCEQEVEDKFKPVRERLQQQLHELYRKAFGSGDSWWQRYTQYLQSEQWAEIRQKVLERDGFACILTGEQYKLQVHHLHYQNVGRERLSDLVTLQETVHEAIHDATHPLHEKYRLKLESLTMVPQTQGDVKW